MFVIDITAQTLSNATSIVKVTFVPNIFILEKN